MKKNIFIFYLLAFILFGLRLGAQNLTVTMTEAGKLEEKITPSYAPLNVTSLTISGPLNGTDLRLIRLMANKGKLTILKMSSAQIVSGGEPYMEAPNGISLYTQENELGSFLFSNCFNKGGSVTVVLPTSVTKIGTYLFENCNSLASVTLPTLITQIPNFSFSGCSGLTSISIPSNVTEIGSGAFIGCTKLSSIKLPSTINEIAYFSFSNCAALTSVTIPNGVEKIGKSAFSGCSLLRTVTFSDSLQIIESGAFDRCLTLQKVSLPKNVSNIGGYAFDQCSAISEFQCLAPTPPTLNASFVFNGINVTSCTLKIPENSMNMYANALQWKDFTKRVGVAPVGNIEEFVSPIRITRNNQTLHIFNISDRDIIHIYSFSGVLMKQVKSKGCSVEIPLETQNPVIIQIGNQVFKY